MGEDKHDLAVYVGCSPPCFRARGVPVFCGTPAGGVTLFSGTPFSPCPPWDTGYRLSFRFGANERLFWRTGQRVSGAGSGIQYVASNYML